MVGFRTRTAFNRRRGFTMIELMIVIVIIAILMGLLIRAVSGSIRKVRITGVKVEINQLEAAIAKFKSDHGIEPPSSITLHELGADWAADTASSSLIRQIWPQFNFALGRDLNGNGTNDAGVAGALPLVGSECLVFFLGGKPNVSSLGGKPLFSMTGFSKDPSDPFAATTGNREAPLFEFNSARLVDRFYPNNTPNNIPEYKDALPGQQLPYLYYSSYDGAGYREVGANAEFGNGGLSAAYRQGPNATDPYWKPSSCQIISPGYDTIYGYGGGYITTGNDRLLIPSTPPPSAAQRVKEADNITNFSEGELQP